MAPMAVESGSQVAVRGRLAVVQTNMKVCASLESEGAKQTRSERYQ